MIAFTFGSALERRLPRFGREQAGVETIGKGLKAVEIGDQRLCISDEGGQNATYASRSSFPTPFPNKSKQLSLILGIPQCLVITFTLRL